MVLEATLSLAGPPMANWHLVKGLTKWQFTQVLIKWLRISNSIPYPYGYCGPGLEPGCLLCPGGTNMKQRHGSNSYQGLIRVWCHVVPYLAMKAMKKIAMKRYVKTTNPLTHPLQFVCHSGRGSDGHLGWTDTSDRLLYLMLLCIQPPTASHPS